MSHIVQVSKFLQPSSSRPIILLRSLQPFYGYTTEKSNTVSLIKFCQQLPRYCTGSKSSDPTKYETSTTHTQDKYNVNNSSCSIDEEYDKLQLSTKDQEKLMKFTKLIEDNTYYTKYKAKIVNFQKSSPHAFQALVDNLLSSKKKYDAPRAKTLQNRKKLVLDDVMKLSSLLSLEPKDISFIWTEYHSSTQSIAAVMSGSKYDSVVEKAETYNSFVLPLPREGRYEFFLVQYGDESFYFTPLAVYHKYKENSPVCLTLSHFDELKESKNLVLLRGEYDKDVVTLKEAQYLAVQLNCYYGETVERRLALMKSFNKNPSEFEHVDLINELKSLETEFSGVFPNLD